MLFIKEKPESPRMFDNSLVDGFSRTHPLMVPLLYVPAFAVLLAVSIWKMDVSGWGSMGLVGMGFVAWTLTEYWLHRTLFHWIPKTWWGPKLHFYVHGVHHQWPKDPYRLVMPPAVSIALFVFFLMVYVLVLGDYGWAFHAGYTLGYMAYDLTHYYLHHGKPKHPWLIKLRRHHLSHHFSDLYKERRFGVSSPLWDWIFRTETADPKVRRQSRAASDA